MNFTRNREDGDTFEWDIEEAAKARKWFRDHGYEGSGELGRQLLHLEAISSMFGIPESLDFDGDLSDVDESHCD